MFPFVRPYCVRVKRKCEYVRRYGYTVPVYLRSLYFKYVRLSSFVSSNPSNQRPSFAIFFFFFFFRRAFLAFHFPDCYCSVVYPSWIRLITSLSVREFTSHISRFNDRVQITSDDVHGNNRHISRIAVNLHSPCTLNIMHVDI